MADGPLLVFGPRSPTYDFGSSHPLTPRRFGPGIDLLRALGAAPGLAPEPAADAELLRVHTARYLSVVRRFSMDPFGRSEAGIGPGGDDPPFAGMHEAAASVAGGSLAAMEALLSRDVEHAFHPGGGLHHAMPDRASGFCIYDDPALAIARARQAGRRVLYLDVDVHHGDGVQAIHAGDPGVLTISFHESGRYLFPGTGFVDELGDGVAAGTVVNVPLEPTAGDAAWLAAIRAIVPPLAAAFGADVVVSQHGADSHAWDPLAHLRVTTTAMGAAARLTDAVAHRFAGGPWLATGGGGYDAYRVVPRSWSLVWLAGAHRAPPAMLPANWRDRWADEAARYGQSPLPDAFNDAPNAGLPVDADQERAEERSRQTVALVRALTVPALLRAAEDLGWWSALRELDASSGAVPTVERSTVGRPGGPTGLAGADPEVAGLEPVIRGPVGAAELERLRFAPRVVAPAGPESALRLLVAAAGGGGRIVIAVSGDVICGVAIVAPRPDHMEIVAVGVAPERRGRGLGTALLARLTTGIEGPISAGITVAERDVVDPSPILTRVAVGRRLLERAGFRVDRATGPVGRADPWAIVGYRP